jgi:L-aminopeptidase/D-esterase-like protein
VAEERWRDIAGPVGSIEPGRRNAITDVPGVRVGHSQAESGERTGVTVVAPASLPPPAGVATVNGMGELTGKLEIDERGTMRTPVYLCGSHAVGVVHRAALLASGHGPDDIVLPVVGECDDGDMADSRTVTGADVERALSALDDEVAEGTVGAGTGMTCFDFPGGIGTASRAVGDHHMRRLAMRPLLGLARAGSYAADGSGEIGIAFTTSTGQDMSDVDLSPYFAAAYEAAHESVYNCLVAARPAQRRDGEMQEAFPIETVRRLARARDAAPAD